MSLHLPWLKASLACTMGTQWDPSWQPTLGSGCPCTGFCCCFSRATCSLTLEDFCPNVQSSVFTSNYSRRRRWPKPSPYRPLLCLPWVHFPLSELWFVSEFRESTVHRPVSISAPQFKYISVAESLLKKGLGSSLAESLSPASWAPVFENGHLSCLCGFLFAFYLWQSINIKVCHNKGSNGIFFPLISRELKPRSGCMQSWWFWGLVSSPCVYSPLSEDTSHIRLGSALRPQFNFTTSSGSLSLIMVAFSDKCVQGLSVNMWGGVMKLSTVNSLMVGCCSRNSFWVCAICQSFHEHVETFTHLSLPRLTPDRNYKYYPYLETPKQGRQVISLGCCICHIHLGLHFSATRDPGSWHKALCSSEAHQKASLTPLDYIHYQTLRPYCQIWTTCGWACQWFTSFPLKVTEKY